MRDDPRIRELEASLFVVSLITQAQTERLAVFDRENAHLRVVAQKVECPYGYRADNGACQLGYPGCACMDDMIVLARYEAFDQRPQVERIEMRARHLEARFLNARERMRIAARNYRSLAEGFQADRAPAKAAAVTAMADLMEAPL